MKTIEYRIEELPFFEHYEVHLKEVVERLSELGKDGWEVAALDLTHHPSYSPAAQPRTALPVLLQREMN